MAEGRGEVRKEHRTPSGVTGAQRFSVRFPAIGRTIDLKWKAAPPGNADGWNNAPRKELAAYAVQKWFLEPEEYVVPTTVCRCVRLSSYRHFDPKAKPTLPGTSCVFGAEALWLEDVEIPAQLYDEARFESDAAYARHLANFNILAYLIDDRDTRADNVLASKSQDNRFVFSVDNGIAFDPLIYNIFMNNWKDIEVPALPRASIARLRKLDAKQLEELAVLAEFRADPSGFLRPVRPGRPIDPTRGTRFRGGVLQLGLTDREIAHLRERIAGLLREIDERKIPLF